eukprot:TRINITY_DN13086_c0_g1_i1.p1 TRINITY_DN13086_c0_g1~~TRINITY_DN13086_c0_g1_i1.p1  ORF type:complete len:207 (+),score=45.88 TRINITY_DN13086_c0_g1_i1:114-734(+)
MSEAEREATGKKGAVTRIWGKLQEPEKSRLASAEKRFGLTWSELHAYKDRMAFPQLPTCMGVEELSPDISLCETQFRGLDRCLEQGMSHESPKQPYARMQICKPHWIRFAKCTKRRDELVMRSVKAWERNYYDSLDEESQKDYMDDLDTKMRYFLYAGSHTTEQQKKKRLEMNAQQMAVRQASLLNRRSADGEPQVAAASSGATPV